MFLAIYMKSSFHRDFCISMFIVVLFKEPRLDGHQKNTYRKFYIHIYAYMLL